MEENKEMLELLRKIEKNSRRQSHFALAQCLFTLAAAAFCGAAAIMIWNFLPQIREFLPQINTVLTQMQSVLTNLEAVTQQLTAIDMSGMVGDVDALVVAGQQSLELTMEKLNTLDIAALNKAISDLSGVVEPLAKFFSAFTR